MKENESGITLIVLVVTVVVLIILIAVTLRGTLGEDSIINQTYNMQNLVNETVDSTTNKLQNLENELRQLDE